MAAGCVSRYFVFTVVFLEVLERGVACNCEAAGVKGYRDHSLERNEK